MWRKSIAALLISLAAGFLGACGQEEESPSVGDAVRQVGDDLEDAADDLGDAMDEASEDIQEAGEKVKEDLENQ